MFYLAVNRGKAERAVQASKIGLLLINLLITINLNRYRRKRPKVDASIFDSALRGPENKEFPTFSDPQLVWNRWQLILVARTRRKKEKKIACPLLANSPVGKFRVLACIG